MNAHSDQRHIAELIPLLHLGGGARGGGTTGIDTAGNLLSLTLSSQWRRGNKTAYAAMRSDLTVSNAQSSQGSTAAMSDGSTVAPPHRRMPAGASR